MWYVIYLTQCKLFQFPVAWMHTCRICTCVEMYLHDMRKEEIEPRIFRRRVVTRQREIGFPKRYTLLVRVCFIKTYRWHTSNPRNIHFHLSTRAETNFQRCMCVRGKLHGFSGGKLIRTSDYYKRLHVSVYLADASLNEYTPSDQRIWSELWLSKLQQTQSECCAPFKALQKWKIKTITMARYDSNTKRHKFAVKMVIFLYCSFYFFLMFVFVVFRVSPLRSINHPKPTLVFVSFWRENSSGEDAIKRSFSYGKFSTPI